MVFKRQEPRLHGVIILTALSLEREAVCAHLDNVGEIFHAAGTLYVQGEFTDRRGICWPVAVGLTGQSNVDAGPLTERAIEWLDPQVLIYVGVAGGLKDVQLGEVVAANEVYYYERANDGFTWRERIKQLQPSHALAQRAHLVVESRSWYTRIKEQVSQAIEQEQDGPRAFVAPIAAGEKVVSNTRAPTYEFLRQHCSDALAVETEGYGFLKAVHNNSFTVPRQALVVRGISDLIAEKTASDAEGWQPRAARHAAAFAFQVLFEFLYDLNPTPDDMSQARLDQLPTDHVPPTATRAELPEHSRLPDFGTNEYFVGRDDELRQIATILKDGGKVVITGIGGIGKTSLATEFLYRYGRYFAEGVFWFNCDDPEQINLELRLCGIAMSLPDFSALDLLAQR